MTMSHDEVRRLETALNAISTSVAGLEATVKAEGRETNRRLDTMNSTFDRRVTDIERDFYGIGGSEGLISRVHGTEDDIGSVREVIADNRREIRKMLDESRVMALKTGGGAGVAGFSLLALIEWAARHFPMNTP